MARDSSALMSAHRVSPADDPDFYPTPPWAARAGAELVLQLDPRARTVWEPACGAGHMAHGLRDYFPTVHMSDIGRYDGNPVIDFLSPSAPGSLPGRDRRPSEASRPDAGESLLGRDRRPSEASRPDAACDWIITNPPFNQAEAFIRLAWERARRGVAMLMRAAGLETQGRHRLLTDDCPLTVFAPFSERVPMHKGRWEPDGTTAAFYAWFIWLKPALRPERFMARSPGGPRAAVWLIAPGAEARLTREDDARLFGVAERTP